MMNSEILQSAVGIHLPFIEYRAWDTRDKRMIAWDELLSYGSGLADYLHDPDELILLPYIGLLDNAKRKVYAYDLVTAGDNYPSLIEWCQHDEGIEGTGWMLHEVYPKRGRYAQKCDRFHILTAYTDGLGQVIGNYFQTPELVGHLRKG